MTSEYTYSRTAYELLKVIPTTVPKKYRTRLKEISHRNIDDWDKWLVLIQELKHNCNETNEIERLFKLNQQWVEAEQNRKETERLARIEREEQYVRLLQENERIRKEKALKEQNESKARMDAVQDTLFGSFDQEDCTDIEPQNVKTHQFHQYCRIDNDKDPIVSVNLILHGCPRYNPSNGQYVHIYDHLHQAK